jgi:hypothetical protein
MIYGNVARQWLMVVFLGFYCVIDSNFHITFYYTAYYPDGSAGPSELQRVGLCGGASLYCMAGVEIALYFLPKLNVTLPSWALALVELPVLLSSSSCGTYRPGYQPVEQQNFLQRN